MAVKKTGKEKEGYTDPTAVSPEEPLFPSLLSPFDIDLFKAGKHYMLYDKMGAHQAEHNGQAGTLFTLWAPGASYVSVIGNFNGWNRYSHPMNVRWDSSGIWEAFVPGTGKKEYYKYYIESHHGYRVEKADPYAFHAETAPATASIIWDLDFRWTDSRWMKERKNGWQHKALSIYEVHLGSWKRVPEEGHRVMSYRELAAELPAYCKMMGFTHVELMPVMEHPFYGSWGYQVTGYFAPCSRYGTPQDFMHLVNELHRAGIGVILDWVPSHFPTDEHGLAYFDGTHLYEHEDPRRGFHQDWHSCIFNYGRNEVRAFLISNALYWLDKYHIDGLRVDAVASMLYLDYSRKEGEWLPNESGGRENLEAVSFLKEFNDAVHSHHPDAFTVAEESTAWPGVTHPTHTGGLGFDLKWMMGWMHDTLFYFRKDPIHRSHHHNLLSFSIYYAFFEKFLLPLSHDEVVYGKGSLLNKMAGDDWQQFAELRLLYTYMYAHPGAKLLFMGSEFAQRNEWNHDRSLDWHETEHPSNIGIQALVKELNHLYRDRPALHKDDYSHHGFEWIDFRDSHNSVLCWIRKGETKSLVIVLNFTPVPRENYRIGVDRAGFYEEIFNSDNREYGGSGVHNRAVLETAPIGMHGRSHSLSLVLPPLGGLILEHSRDYNWF